MRLSTLTKLLLLFALPLPGWAAEEFTVYNPKYRATEELVSLAESAFGGKANFSSLNGKVVINASPKTTASVLKLFAQIDQIAREYKISFRLAARAESGGNSISFKNGRVTLGQKPALGGALSANSGQRASEKDTVQSARLLEGAQAQMALGNNWFPGGFSAKARGGTGDLVTVEFRQREHDSSPAFSLQSEVVLKLGEWKTVGAVNQAASSAETGMVSRGSAGRNETKNLQVKLELVK